jgi:DNA-binding NarL/FixJ family response regulator
VSLLAPPEGAIDLSGRSVQALVLERHAASRLGFGLLLRSQPWIERCLLSSDRDDAVALAQRARPDIAIVDVSDVGPFVGSYIAPLHQAHPAMSLLLSTREGEPTVLKTPLPSSVAGLITSGYSVEQVVEAVKLALVGQSPRPAQNEHPGRFELSAREREVLLLMSTGATNREIAETLHVSAETVKKHAAALYRKLGVRNRTEAAQMAPELSAV